MLFVGTGGKAHDGSKMVVGLPVGTGMIVGFGSELIVAPVVKGMPGTEGLTLETGGRPGKDSPTDGDGFKDTPTEGVEIVGGIARLLSCASAAMAKLNTRMKVPNNIATPYTSLDRNRWSSQLYRV
jgi:hypothetical protein